VFAKFSLQAQASNFTDHLNIINFASLFSGTAIATQRKRADSDWLLEASRDSHLLWPCVDQRLVPILPTSGRPHPKEAIRPSRPLPRALSLEHSHLLMKDQVLQRNISEVSRRYEKPEQPTKQREPGVYAKGRHCNK
jgi:hypothetical protein